MAWDVNAQLATNASITATGNGAWVGVLDVPASNNVQPQANTMLYSTNGNFRIGLVEFKVFFGNVTITGAPTRTDLTLDIEEADDNAGTNVRPVFRFVMGTGAQGATPPGYALDYAGNQTVTTPQAFAGSGLVRKPFLRYAATVTFTAGTSPTATYASVNIYARGVGADIEAVRAFQN